jgi:hypothetical protein
MSPTPSKRSRSSKQNSAGAAALRRLGALCAALTIFGVSASPSRATAEPGVTVTLDAASPSWAISPDLLSANDGVWHDPNQPAGRGAVVASSNVRMVRWPGGTLGDLYHWHSNTMCKWDADKDARFDRFEQGFVIPNNFDVAITLNYGTDQTCTHGGEPSEAAAWVAYARKQGYPVRFWTIGNEVYGHWEPDLHAKPHDPVTYAQQVNTGFYPAIHRADPSAQVGIVVNSPSIDYTDKRWNGIVLSQVQHYDFVEVHLYWPNAGNYATDHEVVYAARDVFRAALRGLRSQLAAAGHPDIPIFIGETNSSVLDHPGKQSISISDGLFYGQELGEALDAGVAGTAWWADMEQGCISGGDNSPSLYGWQDFGAIATISDGTWTGCNAKITPPYGTLYPTARVEQVVSTFANAGEHVLPSAVAPSDRDVRAYGATFGSGYAVLLFNLNRDASIPTTVGVANGSGTMFAATTTTYGRAQYDQSKIGLWSGPDVEQLGLQSLPLQLTLPPWSVTALQLQ